MLSESSYMTAMTVYLGAAGLMLLCLLLWLRRRLHPAVTALLVLLAAALLLTPAYPRPEVSTLAPALVVAAFQWLTQGPDAATHALRPLGFMVAVAVAVSCLIALFTVWLRRKRAAGEPAPHAQ